MVAGWLCLVLCTVTLLWPVGYAYPGAFSIPPYDELTARVIAETRSLNGSANCDIYHSGSIRPHKVLLFVDSSFFPLFRNWMIYYQEACGTTMDSLRRLEVVCMDGNVTQLLDTLSVNCSDTYSSIVYQHQNRRHKHQSSMVWMKRLEIINAILSTGTDLILSDSDAYWVGNPYPDLNRFAENSHIIASRGWFPFSLSRSWGSTLCMGFIYVKASAFTLYFFDQVLRNMMQKQLELEAYHHYLQTNSTLYIHVERNQSFVFDPHWWASVENKEPDDQYSSNRLLYDMHIQWPPLMNLTYRTSAHHGVVPYAQHNYRITLLPENLYLRNCANNDLKRIARLRYPSRAAYQVVQQRISAATVAHCLLSPGESRRKENYLVYYSLWRLPYNASAVMDFIQTDLRVRRARRNITSVLAVRRTRHALPGRMQNQLQDSPSAVYLNLSEAFQTSRWPGKAHNGTHARGAKPLRLPAPRRPTRTSPLPPPRPESGPRTGLLTSAERGADDVYPTQASREAVELQRRRQRLLERMKEIRAKHLRVSEHSPASATAAARHRREGLEGGGVDKPPVPWLQASSPGKARRMSRQAQYAERDVRGAGELSPAGSARQALRTAGREDERREEG